jgi:hypothetical protein
MDPLGLGFEHFDAEGLWRDAENGKPIDATGEITHSDINGTFDGVVDLANKLSTSAQVEACVVKQWFRFGYGRGEDDADQCTLEALNKVFETGDFKELVIALTQTDAFLYRSNGQGGAQ